MRLLKQLNELRAHRREALANEAENTVRAIDAQIERCFGEMESALGAFYQHRKEHGC
jgi:hypothetical protein